MSSQLSTEARYPAHIFYSEEDGGFIAIAPDLPGSSAFGGTQEEALAELQHAISAWIEAATAAGNLIPQPTSSKIETQPSGKILIRIPRSLHRQLIDGSKREGTSLNQHIVYLLSYASATTNIMENALRTLRNAIPQTVAISTATRWGVTVGTGESVTTRFVTETLPGAQTQPGLLTIKNTARAAQIVYPREGGVAAGTFLLPWIASHG